ncbi:hypothetical protein ABT168_39740, partial [Streptomyces sp. NPDC001793]|uniref:hypothetical protein n=1 Tax=Streptomyces sp. NPDC001793 TaxID=3154657 RepID=UPI00331D4908
MSLLREYSGDEGNAGAAGDAESRGGGRGGCGGGATEEQLASFARDFHLPDDLVPGYRALMPDATVL